MRTLRRAKPLEHVQTRRPRREDTPSKEWPWEWSLAEAESRGSSPATYMDGHLGHLEETPTNSSTCDTTPRCPDGHLGVKPQGIENQPLALDGLDGHLQAAPPIPVFSALTADVLWCGTCKEAVSFRTLPQLDDDAEVYLCKTCDTEVGRKHSTPPSSRNGPQASDDVLLATQTSSGDEDADDEGVL
jgi:hypothetical protein